MDQFDLVSRLTKTTSCGSFCADFVIGGTHMERYLAPMLTALLMASAASAHTEIFPSEARTMILADENLVVLDVREYSEFCGSLDHIEDAANLPWNSGVLQARVAELPTDANIVVVCMSGGRSHQAASFLDGQGFTNVYDMQGGMNAWDWETEACGSAPVVTLRKNPMGSEINWTPVPGTQDYDLIRGNVENIYDAGTYIDLGPSLCLVEGSPFTYHTDTDLPDGTYFFLVRQVEGTWGESSDNSTRSPVPVNCDGALD